MHRIARQTRTWRIGELAAETGITVRTLHHYDQLGLLSPSSRTSAGHRSYTTDDVQQLHRIIVLRSCGLSLEEIGTVLQASARSDLGELLSRQLDIVEERISQAVGLRTRLVKVLDALKRTSEPSITEIVKLIEETTSMNQPMTHEQLAKLTEERARKVREMSAEEFATLKQKLEQAWAALSHEEQTRLVEQRRAQLAAIEGACQR